MYCKNCGGDGHGAGECSKPKLRPRLNLPSPEVLAEAERVVGRVADAMFGKDPPVAFDGKRVIAVTKQSNTETLLSNARHCPTCRCKPKVYKTNADKQAAYRKRKKGE